ncbi:hypothetical protein BD310DRAFT_818248 [Dichomitus squalens]|uniref:DUF6534 domain-containing protein n=1 Tax=Dichomitus squalens TaxID=114155 RepID=A0A4Q9PX00_9APHY|nr:hypothetical protein BD310DRAFT_818248 [Dichomitus squalens]
MASTVIVPATGASPAVELGSTYGVYLISVIVTGVLFGATCLQTLYYYEQFPQDPRVLKLTVSGALDCLTLVLDSHACYYYLISNFNNVSALRQEVWSAQAELLVTYTVVFIVQIFFILRMYHLRPHLWYIPLFFGVVAVVSWAHVPYEVTWQLSLHDTSWLDTAGPEVVHPLIANWITGNIVDIGITITWCVYLWGEKIPGGRPKTNVMLNRIIIFMVNRGAIAAWVQVLTFLTKILFPRTFVWLAFHNVLSKIYNISMLATLNARVGLRKIVMDSSLDNTKPSTVLFAAQSRPVSKVPPLPVPSRQQMATIEFVDQPSYPQPAYEQRSVRLAPYDERSMSTAAYDQRSALNQRTLVSDRDSMMTDMTDYPPYVGRAITTGSRYTRATLRDDVEAKRFHDTTSYES